MKWKNEMKEWWKGNKCSRISPASHTPSTDVGWRRTSSMMKNQLDAEEPVVWWKEWAEEFGSEERETFKQIQVSRTVPSSAGHRVIWNKWEHSRPRFPFLNWKGWNRKALEKRESESTGKQRTGKHWKSCIGKHWTYDSLQCRHLLSLFLSHLFPPLSHSFRHDSILVSFSFHSRFILIPISSFLHQLHPQFVTICFHEGICLRCI